MLNNREVVLTTHARRTMVARKVTMQEVLQVLTNYNSRTESLEHRGRPTPDTFVYRGDTLGVVTVEGPNRIAIKTVLLASPDQWTDEDARNREGTAP